MTTQLSPGVKASDATPLMKDLAEKPTAVAGFIGVADRGPIGAATLVTSWTEYVEKFGGYNANSDMALAVAQFFREGGKYAWIVRVVHYSDVDGATVATAAKGAVTLQTAAASASAGAVISSNSATFELASGDTLEVLVDTAIPGTEETATITAVAAVETCVSTETFALSNAETLTVQIDGGSTQTVTFLTGSFSAIGAATAEEVAAVINAGLIGASCTVIGGNTVRITSDVLGTSSKVQITGGTSNAALGFPVDLNTGTGNVADVANVTGAELKTIIELAVTQGSGVTVSGTTTITITSNTTGATSSVQILAASTADDEIGFDNAVNYGSAGTAVNTLVCNGKTEGVFAANITIQVAAATSGTASEFNLYVLVSGLVKERWKNISMGDTLANFCETVINHADTGSNLISVTDQDAAGSVTAQRPANATSAAMTGGNDGLASIADADFIGSEAGVNGLYGLNAIHNLSLLAVPGRATAGVASGLIVYADTYREGMVYVVFDTPTGNTYTQAITYVGTTAALKDGAANGSTYWPWYKVVNPSVAVYGNEDSVDVPPSGGIMGLMSRLDNTKKGGIYKSPAGTENGHLRGCIGFQDEAVLRDEIRDLLYPERINPITQYAAGPRHVDGGRALDSNSNWPFVNQSRGVIHIKHDVVELLQFVKHENNTPELRARVKRMVEIYLRGQMGIGAFASKNPETAFFVDVSEELNPAPQVAKGKLKVRMGLAMATPAEFINVEVSKDTRAFDEAA